MSALGRKQTLRFQMPGGDAAKESRSGSWCGNRTLPSFTKEGKER